MYFLSKSEKSENLSSSSTGKEKLLELSNKLQDELLNGYYWFKCYTVSF